MKKPFAGLAGFREALLKAPFLQAALLRVRQIKPLLAVALTVVLIAGVSLARATGDGSSTSTTDPTPSPTSPSPTPSDEGVSLPDGAGGGGSINNEVVVLNITDGRFAHRARSGMARVTGGPVSNTNSAAATSSCSDCRTVAVAIQAVLVMGNANEIAPRNQAVAINQNCQRCNSFALAYQYVVTTGGVVRLTSEGEQRIAGLEAQIREVAGTKLPFLELEARIDPLVKKMWAVIDEEVVAAGGSPSGREKKDRDQAETDGPSPSPSETPESPSPSPDPSETQMPEPEESAGPSSEPSESPSPEVSDSPTPAEPEG